MELITLFAIVFIHECGHAAAAALLGCRVQSIQMLPFGEWQSLKMGEADSISRDCNRLGGPAAKSADGWHGFTAALSSVG